MIFIHGETSLWPLMRLLSLRAILNRNICGIYADIPRSSYQHREAAAHERREHKHTRWEHAHPEPIKQRPD